MHLRTCALAGAGTLILAAAALGQANDPTVFAVSTSGDNLLSYTVAPDGTLTLASQIATGNAPQSMSLSPDGAILAVGHGTASTTIEEFRLYQVNADASFTPLLNTVVPDSPLDVQWLNNNVLAVTETQIGPSSVSVYNFNRTTNTLSQVDGFAPGNFVASLAVGGDFLFTETSFQTPNNAVFSRRFDANGMLSGGDSTLVGTGNEFVTDLIATSDGRFLFGPGGVSGATDDLLFSFAVDSNGQLTAAPGSPIMTGTRAPRRTGALTGRLDSLRQQQRLQQRRGAHRRLRDRPDHRRALRDRKCHRRR